MYSPEYKISTKLCGKLQVSQFTYLHRSISYQFSNDVESKLANFLQLICRVETESDGTLRSTGAEVKGKEANGVGGQHSCTVSEHGLSSITTADAHTSTASSRLN